MINENLLEAYCIKQVSEPKAMNGAAIVGARIALKPFHRIALVLSFSDSVGAVVDFTLKQHDAAAAGTSKVLAVAAPYYHKVGAATSFTKVSQAVAASNYVLSPLLAAEPGVVVIEILPEDLDVNGGFTHFSVDFVDSTAAKVVGAMYIGLPNTKPAYSVVC